MVIKLPLCPSVNEYLMPANNRLIKTSIARAFEDRINRIKKVPSHRTLFEEATRIFTGRFLRVDTYYVFLKSRIIGKKNQIKVIDYLNRQKISFDCLSLCIEIDDKYFKSGFHELILCDSDEEQCIIFNITVQESIRSLSDLRKELLLKL